MSVPRHSNRAAPALTALAEADPALAALALWCKHRDGPAKGPAETRGQTITYGPAFNDLTRPEQMGIAAHHILHVALCHSARAAALAARLGRAFNAELFNLAADAIVNEVVLAGGFALPRPRVELAGLLGAALKSRDTAPLTHWDAERLYFKLAEGGADGRTPTREATKAYADAQGFRDDLEGADDQTGEPDQGPSDWQARVERAMAEGRAAGRGIGRLAGQLADIPRTETPWEQRLRGILTRVTLPNDARARLRPARRWLAAEADARAYGKPTPGFEAQVSRLAESPVIAVLCDSSASVVPPLRQRFGGEVARIAERTGAEVRLVIFDTAVQVDTTLAAHSAQRTLKELAFPDGGGTDFAPAFAAAMTPRPSAIVILTDLEGEVPPDPAPVPVFWATPEAPKVLPDYGQILVLDR